MQNSVLEQQGKNTTNLSRALEFCQKTATNLPIQVARVEDLIAVRKRVEEISLQSSDLPINALRSSSFWADLEDLVAYANALAPMIDSVVFRNIARQTLQGGAHSTNLGLSLDSGTETAEIPRTLQAEDIMRICVDEALPSFMDVWKRLLSSDLDNLSLENAEQYFSQVDDASLDKEVAVASSILAVNPSKLSSESRSAIRICSSLKRHRKKIEELRMVAELFSCQDTETLNEFVRMTTSPEDVVMASFLPVSKTICHLQEALGESGSVLITQLSKASDLIEYLDKFPNDKLP